MRKHSKDEEEGAKAFEAARRTVWQMDKEMETLLEGLRQERECIYADIRIAKQKGLGTDWLLGEMMGIDKSITLLIPDETESQ